MRQLCYLDTWSGCEDSPVHPQTSRTTLCPVTSKLILLMYEERIESVSTFVGYLDPDPHLWAIFRRIRIYWLPESGSTYKLYKKLAQNDKNKKYKGSLSREAFLATKAPKKSKYGTAICKALIGHDNIGQVYTMVRCTVGTQRLLRRPRLYLPGQLTSGHFTTVIGPSLWNYPYTQYGTLGRTIGAMENQPSSTGTYSK